eukprot:scaffold84244_cov33-Tisochrysis_lutea.AAC.3
MRLIGAGRDADDDGHVDGAEAQELVGDPHLQSQFIGLAHVAHQQGDNVAEGARCERIEHARAILVVINLARASTAQVADCVRQIGRTRPFHHQRNLKDDERGTDTGWVRSALAHQTLQAKRSSSPGELRAVGALDGKDGADLQGASESPKGEEVGREGYAAALGKHHERKQPHSLAVRLKLELLSSGYVPRRAMVGARESGWRHVLKWGEFG